MAAAAEGLGERPGLPSIYKASRSIKRRENCLLYNALRSIYEDSVFVAEIAQLWPELPLVANLRCGLWYSSRVHSTCYFKSTDGHTNNWSFSTSRLNLHVAVLAGQRGGCLIVDSTRKGKRFPDSMSKTIPIWACVLNRAIARRMRRREPEQSAQGGGSGGMEVYCSTNEIVDEHAASIDWDTSLHLPLWVSSTEKAAIENRLEEWTEQFEDCGADIDTLASSLKKPLRPLWISQMTIIWLNEVPTSDSWDFTPMILVSASSPNGVVQQRSTCEFSWHYIPGAGDDEESWARGLSPNLFWKHASELIRSGPDLCNQKVGELIEKDRVYHAQRGEYAPQVSTKYHKPVANNGCLITGESNVNCQLLNSEIKTDHSSTSYNNQGSIFWVGSSNLAIGSTSNDAVAYFRLPIVTPKVDRFSLLKSLPLAISFAKLNLCRGKKLIVSCHNGSFDEGKSFSSLCVTKWEVKKRLVFICKYVTIARPCRGNLKQVYSFLRKEKESLDNVVDDLV
ncbi:hypothetical protein Taro_011249 [Colocasia esculenta]|uniref:Initiator tRNA phosphoribosyl transferase family protein n=1 Tax=Colocasia esculenta TaxID=4460 RepID=A0A843U9D0_COLES|nr:hypothetical protein [Colocasia esculenta]